jgi:hypothetical protein
MPPISSSHPPRNPSSDSRSRHYRKCTICRHPQRDEIEREFLAWISPAAIAERFALYDRRPIYRHAHATGLFRRRARRIAASLEGALAHASMVRPTPQVLVRAVELYALLRDMDVDSSPAVPRRLARRLSRPRTAESNRHAPRLENPVTHGGTA